MTSILSRATSETCDPNTTSSRPTRSFSRHKSIPFAPTAMPLPSVSGSNSQTDAPAAPSAAAAPPSSPNASTSTSNSANANATPSSASSNRTLRFAERPWNAALTSRLQSGTGHDAGASSSGSSSNAQAGPSRSNARSDVIDLTEEGSPPVGTSTRTRARLVLPRTTATTMTANHQANDEAGPSRPNRRGAATPAETLELSSGSEDDDDEIVVIEPSEGAQNARVTRSNPNGRVQPNGNGNASAANNGVAARAAAPVDALRQRLDALRARLEADLAPRLGFAPRNANRNPLENDRATNHNHRGGPGAGLDVFNRLIYGRGFDHDEPFEFDYGGGDHYLGGGGGGGYRDMPWDQLAFNMRGFVGLFNNDAGGGWGGQERVRQGKKYAIRMSHPRKVEPGFSRDIIEPIDPDNPPPKPAATKGKGRGRGKNAKAAKEVEVVETEPVCASCLEPLLLAQSGDQRPWALKCGHCVCGKCINEAKSRAKIARMGTWVKDVEYLDEDEDDDDLEYVGSTTTNGRKRKAATDLNPKAKKGKGKSLSELTQVEDEWTCCPVVGCAGEKTDLLVPEGDFRGAFELFV